MNKTDKNNSIIIKVNTPKNALKTIDIETLPRTVSPEYIADVIFEDILKTPYREPDFKVFREAIWNNLEINRKQEQQIYEFFGFMAQQGNIKVASIG